MIDITLKLDENTAVYEGDPRFYLERWRNIEQDGFMLSRITMGTHTGTHMDAPCHFIEGGKAICDLPLDLFVGECLVTDNINAFTGGYKRVLFSCAKGGGRLTEEQARRLVDLRVCLVGTEMLSIGNDAVHKILLGADCAIIEKLNLRQVRPGTYDLCAAPLKIDADGTPVRAFLIEREVL